MKKKRQAEKHSKSRRFSQAAAQTGYIHREGISQRAQGMITILGMCMSRVELR